MLVIRTGKPGHGKTLNTIREVDQKAHAEGRVVYFHNINGLKPDQLQAQWFEFEDPEKWFELPNDSIIVVDEAQGWFGSRDPRARPPEHITRFETMRHQGHEVHLVTQDPRYLDVHLRRLCNTHIHYWRVFKSAQLLRFESEVVVEKVELKTSFKDADKKSLRLDKRYFGAYTSSNAKHHFQAKVPTKFILAICVLVGAGILVYRAYERYNTEKAQAETASDAPAGSMVDQVRDTVGAFIKPVGEAKADAPESVASYIGRRVPRIPQVPSSAPIYDELTRPVSFPRLYCMSSTDPATYAREFGRMAHAVVNGTPTVCQCYTQQSTRVETDFAFCMRVVENGFFDPTLPDRSAGERTQQVQNNQPPAMQAARPGAAQPASGTNMTVVPYQKGQFLW
ncbi:MAG: zonular occludens toxin [Pseudomonadales bacterium RIFCSPHIGHO2_01_FULL_64_12]|uniref:Zonular occludens toxin domain-containing protein n=1 Tax=Stutzerimonas stutzeri TaxID=316 RepID=A0AA42P7H1_STUST|nr:zonular occludens toxin domain-containing protein [Stutzerimonas stutzeri]MDH1235135.1 zonular occludens toxin domain-containing protein [Stutzerimonas stutzeri]OHC20119.1 MAG: zonular occludens toxin [Pseudomonadales bacterium RIFCSPHIGHO2_01_FULL_64_12]